MVSCEIVPLTDITGDLQVSDVACKMHHNTHHPALNVFVGITLLTGAAAAVCTNFTLDHTYEEDPNTFDGSNVVLVDQLVCPSDSKYNCNFTKTSYEITVNRTLQKSGEIDLGLSDEESDAIFKLAQDAFNDDMEDLPNETAKNFTSLTRNVTTTTIKQGSPILSVEPGKNQTLEFYPMFAYAYGRLENCTNDTLNDLFVTVGTPYLTRDSRLNNETVLAGDWSSSTDNITDTSGAMSLVNAPTGGILSWVVAATVGFGFVM